MNRKIIETVRQLVNGRPVCAMPQRCRTTPGLSFNQLMEREWEELVIRFNEEKGDYEFRTACCAGAPAC